MIDLLPGRDGEALKVLLAANPQVEVITRDRWPAYIPAATAAAPGRNRWPIGPTCGGTREAVEKILSRVGPEARAANADAERGGSCGSGAAKELMAMIRQKRATTLADWATKVVVLGDPPLEELGGQLALGRGGRAGGDDGAVEYWPSERSDCLLGRGYEYAIGASEGVPEGPTVSKTQERGEPRITQPAG